MAPGANRPGNVSEDPAASSPYLAEAELISRILAGERDRYYDLIAPYQRVVYVSALSLLHNETEAEDCAQEAFIKAFCHLNEFKGESKFGSWVVRIALNEAKMKLRKLRPGLYESLDEKPAGSNNHEEREYVPQVLQDWREIPSEELERSEIREILEKAIRSLAPIYREVFILRDVQDYDIATTAEILDVSAAVVKTRLVRARLQMRDLLAPLLKNSHVLSRQIFRRGRNPWL
jgi:RNA polymerase sigma-70 factor (ECF subfamily)